MVTKITKSSIQLRVSSFWKCYFIRKLKASDLELRALPLLVISLLFLLCVFWSFLFASSVTRYSDIFNRFFQIERPLPPSLTYWTNRLVLSYLFLFFFFNFCWTSIHLDVTSLVLCSVFLPLVDCSVACNLNILSLDVLQLFSSFVTQKDNRIRRLFGIVYYKAIRSSPTSVNRPLTTLFFAL